MRTKQNLIFRTCLFICLTILMVLVITETGWAARFKKEYRLQVNVAPSYYWSMGAVKFAELVMEKTNGDIRIKPYFGSTLLKGAQLKSTQMVAKGVIDCAYESTINISPVIPEANIFHLPFFINTFENLDKMKTGQSGRVVFEAMEKVGLKPLAWGENGFRQLTTRMGPVFTPEDLVGLRVRVVGNPLFMDTFRQLGADPVNMNWGDAQTAFQQGVVDGQENPVGILIPVQIWQYHKYITLWNYLVDPLVIFWNLKQWEAFPRDIQKAIREAAEESGRYETALCRAGLDGGTSIRVLKNEFSRDMAIPDPVGFMTAKGMTVSNLTAEQIKAFAVATRPVLEKWTRRIGGDLVEKAKMDMAKSVEHNKQDIP